MEFGAQPKNGWLKISIAITFAITMCSLSIADARRIALENQRLVLIDVDENGNFPDSLSSLSFPSTAKHIAFPKTGIEIARNAGKVTNLSGRRQTFKNNLGPRITPTFTSILDGSEIPVTRSRVVVAKKSGVKKANERLLIIHKPKRVK